MLNDSNPLYKLATDPHGLTQTFCSADPSSLWRASPRQALAEQKRSSRFAGYKIQTSVAHKDIKHYYLIGDWKNKAYRLLTNGVY